MCTPVKDDMQMYTFILFSSIEHNNNAQNTGLKTWPRFDHNFQQSATFDHIFRGLLCWLLYNGQPIMTQEFEYPTIATQQPTIATYAFSPARGTKKDR